MRRPGTGVSQQWTVKAKMAMARIMGKMPMPPQELHAHYLRVALALPPMTQALLVR